MTAESGAVRAYRPLLALIVVGGLAIRLLHFALPLGSDDQVWIKVAREIAGGQTHTDLPVYYTRLVWTWLLIGWGTLGSLTLEWTSVLMFILGALTILLVAAAARTAFNDRAALLAALVYAAHPLAITFDTAALPDGLAVCLLAATIAAFIHYLKERRARTLLICGLIIGLQFGVKNYFMLVSLPCALTIVALHIPWRQRCAQIGLLAGSAIAGLAVALLIGAVSGVGVGPHIEGAGHYVDYISQGGGSESVRSDLVRFAALLVGRGEVLTVLFFGFGAAIGCLTLFGLIATAVGARRNPVLLFIAATVLLFVLFLMLMPVRLSPLTFTQFHERYLTVVLPALSIATGAALAAAWQALTARPLKIAAAGMLLAVVAYGGWVPNGMHDRYGVLEMRGLAQALGMAPGTHTQVLLLPIHFRRLVPDSFYEQGVTLRYVDFASTASLDSALDAIAADPTVAIIAFRKPFRTLSERLRTGDYSDATSDALEAGLVPTARSRGYSIEAVRVPYDSLRVWLARAGVDTRGQLVAWLIRKPVT